jgi:hypothetical protein
MKNWSFSFVYIVVFVAIYFLFWTARRNPQKRWVHILFGRMYGPRTDVKNMTRRDLFQSGLSFLFWGIVSLFSCVLIIFLAGIFSNGEGFPTLGLVGLFATICGLLRDKDCVPSYHETKK